MEWILFQRNLRNIKAMGYPSRSNQIYWCPTTGREAKKKQISEKIGQRKRYPKTLIYINESLTPDNRQLLKKASGKTKEKHYKYKGYTIKGEILVKNGDYSEHISIKCGTDIDKVV